MKLIVRYPSKTFIMVAAHLKPLLLHRSFHRRIPTRTMWCNVLEYEYKWWSGEFHVVLRWQDKHIDFWRLIYCYGSGRSQTLSERLLLLFKLDNIHKKTTEELNKIDFKDIHLMKRPGYLSCLKRLKTCGSLLRRKQFTTKFWNAILDAMSCVSYEEIFQNMENVFHIDVVFQTLLSLKLQYFVQYFVDILIIR